MIFLGFIGIIKLFERTLFDCYKVPTKKGQSRGFHRRKKGCYVAYRWFQRISLLLWGVHTVLLPDLLHIRVEKTIAYEIAEALLAVKAVQLRPEKPFQWASGWKSPIYCDNRITLSYPAVRSLIKENLVKLVQHQFPTVSCIAGVATAGIPQGALVADALALPFLYVRASPKSHGLENLIEGKAEPDAQIVVIEDLISTGSSSLKAAEALRQAGYKVLGMAAVFTYNFQVAHDNFQAAGLPFYALSNYDELVACALEKGLIDKNMIATLQAWRVAPDTWGQS